MDIASLQAFVAVAEQGSFSHAAETLFLTQPAVSKRVSNLEAELETRLFDRIGRTVLLTEAGRLLLPRARSILDELEDSRRAIASLSDEVAGVLALATSHHIGLHHLPNWLRRFRKEYPQVSLDLQFMESDAAYHQMNKRNAELAFVTLSDSMNPQFQILVQWPDPMAFVIGANHPLAKLSSPTLKDLAQHPALLPDTSTATYRVVSRLFLEANLPLNPLMPTNYLETIKMMTSVGLGWSVLPVSMLDNSLRVLEVGHPVTRVLGAVALSGRQLSNGARALLEIVEAEETGA